MQIAEVAKRYGISVDTIRYYERIGLVPHVTRLPNGIRDFAEYDCGWVEFIRCMRESGVQIEALVEYVALFQEGEHTAAARLEILEEQRAKLVAKLEEMQATAKRLDAKIDRHRDEPPRVALLGARVEGHGLPHREGGREAGRGLHARRDRSP